MFRMSSKKMTQTIEALIELQQFPHNAFVQQAIDVAYNNMFEPSIDSQETIMDLLVILKKGKKLGEYQPNDDEQLVLKAICNCGRINKQVQTSFFDFIIQGNLST